MLREDVDRGRVLENSAMLNNGVKGQARRRRRRRSVFV